MHFLNKYSNKVLTQNIGYDILFVEAEMLTKLERRTYMIQKYFVDDILIHRDNKKLLKVLDAFKDLDYTTFYYYEVQDLETNLTERLSQSFMEDKYVSRKNIDDEINCHQKEINKYVDEVSNLRWLAEEMKNKIKRVENRKDNKR